MDARLRSLLTLTALGLLLVVAGAWGLSALTKPFPQSAEPGPCTTVPFGPGDRIKRADVTVSVLNAGTRNGLAGLTMDLFVDAGFGQGQEGNVEGDRKVANVEIWTDQPASPAVKLVARQLGDAVKVVRREPTVAGVQVVVGDDFEDLVDGPRRIRVREEVEVCSPTTDADPI